MQKELGMKNLKNKTYCIKYGGFLTKLWRIDIQKELPDLSIGNTMENMVKTLEIIELKHFNDQVNNKRSLAHLIWILFREK